MKKDLAEIIFILDRSGSMSGIESDTIEGYNSFLAAQRKVEGEAQVTTVLFDDKYELLHDGVNIKDVKPITEKEYFALGSTALLDAIGKTIINVGIRLNNTHESERPAKVIFVITTDGQENASREFSYKKIKEMISEQQYKYSWEFIFLGANNDAVKEAESLGIKASRASNYVADSHGTDIMYCTLAENVASYRKTGELGENLSEDITKNTNKKKRKYGHYSTIKFMCSEEFNKIKNIYENKDNDSIIGGVYFRPIYDKVTAVDLCEESIKPLIGIGYKNTQYIKYRDTEDTIKNSISERLIQLNKKRQNIKGMGTKKRFEANLIKKAQANELRLEHININPDLRFIHSQWRMPGITAECNVTDLLAVDIKKNCLVIVELKTKKDIKAYSQVKKYMDYFKDNSKKLTPFFLEVARMMGKLYNCKELQTIENIDNEIYGVVSWPNEEDNYENLYSAKVTDVEGKMIIATLNDGIEAKVVI